MSQARLSVDGAKGASAALWDWLRSERELRGQVHREAVASSAGEMGSGTDIVVTLVSSGTAAVLARSISVWLTQRHSDIKITIARPDGRELIIDTKRVKARDAEGLLRDALGTAHDPSFDGGPSSASVRDDLTKPNGTST